MAESIKQAMPWVLLQGWAGFNAELNLELERLWLRNLGRDDRCFAADLLQL